MIGLTLDKRIKLIAGMVVLGIVFIITGAFIDGKGAFLSGFGTGLLLVGAPLLVFFVIKYNNEEFKTDYNLSINDERIKRNIGIAQAAGYKLMVVSILLVAVITYVLEITMYPFILLTVVLIMVYVKLYLKKLNNNV